MSVSPGIEENIEIAEGVADVGVSPELSAKVEVEPEVEAEGSEGPDANDDEPGVEAPEESGEDQQHDADEDEDENFGGIDTVEFPVESAEDKPDDITDAPTVPTEDVSTEDTPSGDVPTDNISTGDLPTDDTPQVPEDFPEVSPPISEDAPEDAPEDALEAAPAPDVPDAATEENIDIKEDSESLDDLIPEFPKTEDQGVLEASTTELVDYTEQPEQSEPFDDFQQDEFPAPEDTEFQPSLDEVVEPEDPDFDIDNNDLYSSVGDVQEDIENISEDSIGDDISEDIPEGIPKDIQEDPEENEDLVAGILGNDGLNEEDKIQPEYLTTQIEGTVDEPVIKQEIPIPILGDTEEEDEEEEDDEDKPSTLKQTHIIVVPSYASWFNMKKIHQIEEESLPEFFKTSHPSKSPKIYANYRNFMINSYRLNPNEFLTLTSCRRNLVGDVGTLMRVHRFLNKWGLINYQVRPLFKPSYSMDRLPNGTLVGLPFTGDYHVRYDTPRGLFPFETFKISPERVDIPMLKKLLNVDEQNDQNGVNGAAKKRPAESTELPNKKQKDSWTEEESSRLVLGIKQHPNDWYKIAEFVGPKKTPQQCILKFLKLPVEDKFNPVGHENDSTALKLLKYAPNFPVSAIDNPVLSNITFMTQLVDGDVARAASQRASKVMDEKIIEKIKEVYEPKKEVSKESDSVDDLMDLDNIEETPTSETSNKNGSALKEELTEDDTDIKDVISSTFGVIGARSHLFATYEEREVHKLSATIVNHELSKIEVKLNKVEELERIYERERRHLAKQQEEVFIDRLALAKSTVNITRKLDDAIALFDNSIKTGANDKLASITSLLAEAKTMLYKPTRQSLTQLPENINNGEAHELGNGAGAAASDVVNEDELKPLSLTDPQTFKVWAP